jgi:hypothetical protein
MDIIDKASTTGYVSIGMLDYESITSFSKNGEAQI